MHSLACPSDGDMAGRRRRAPFDDEAPQIAFGVVGDEFARHQVIEQGLAMIIEIDAAKTFGDLDADLERAGNQSHRRRPRSMRDQEQIRAQIKFTPFLVAGPIDPPDAIDAGRDRQIERDVYVGRHSARG